LPPSIIDVEGVEQPILEASPS